MPGYFDTMRLPIKMGRAITYRDDAKAPAVVIINERAARGFWPGEDPIGKRFALGGENGKQPNWRTVIGVVANARLDDMVSNPYPEMYLAALQTPEFMGEGSDPIGPHMAYITLVVRGDGNPAELTRQVTEAVRSFDRNLPISQVFTMDEAVSAATAQPRFEMLLLGLFRRGRTGFGGGRDLRCHELRSIAAHARDWHPDVVGSEPRRRPADGDLARRHTGAGGHGGRSGGSQSARKGDEQNAVWRAAYRSVDVRRCHRHSRVSGATGSRGPGAQGHADRADGGAAK